MTMNDQKPYQPRHLSPERQKSSSEKGRRQNLALYALCALLLCVFVMSVLKVGRALRKDELNGNWALDQTTVYMFDGKGNGVLTLPLNSFEFSYRIQDSYLILDFKDETAVDAGYRYSFVGSTLTLDSNTGTVYQLEKLTQ